MSDDAAVQEWTRVTKIIMDRDGVTQEQADAGLLWALADAKTKAEAFEAVEVAVANLKAAVGL